MQKQKYKIIFSLLLILSFLSGKIYGSVSARDQLYDQYEYICHCPSDIQKHIPRLRNLSLECSSVVEIGIRSMVSSWGILQGLSENSYKSCRYIGIDIATPPLDSLNLARKLAKANGINYSFWKKNDMNVDIPIVDLLFIDSLHTYCHLTYELEKFSPKVRKYIAMHDTSQPWENLDDFEYRGDRSEYPAFIDRNKRGLWPAVEDFLARHPEWELYERYFDDHGFTVLKRVAQ